MNLVILLVAILFYCEEVPVDNSDPLIQSWMAKSTVFPDIGTTKSIFQPSILAVFGADTAQLGEDYLVRCDYNGDGVADTDWLDSIPATQTFTETGKHILNFEFKDTSGVTFTAICSVYVQTLIQITPTNTSGYGQNNIDWSRDGSNRIAFDMYGADSGGNQNLFYIEYPNGVPVKVSSNPTPGFYFFDQFPEWSPDGETIACYSSNGLDIIDIENGQRTTLDAAGYYIMLAWSPDGHWLAYWDGQKTLLYDLEMGTSSELFADPHYVAWSPDGSKIAVSSGVRSPTTLNILDFESQSILEAHTVTAFGSKLEWSPDGRWISLGFQNDTGYLFNAKTGQTHTFRPDGVIGAWFPSWSEDGTLLAFEGKKNTSGEWESIWAIEFPEDY